MNDWVEDHRGAIRALMVFASLLFVLPIIGFVNPLWTALYALLPWLVIVVFQPHPVYAEHPWTETAAFLLWPPLVFASSVYAAHLIVSSGQRWRNAAIAIWLISAAVVVPTSWFINFNSRWPVFGVYD